MSGWHDPRCKNEGLHSVPKECEIMTPHDQIHPNNMDGMKESFRESLRERARDIAFEAFNQLMLVPEFRWQGILQEALLQFAGEQRDSAIRECTKIVNEAYNDAMAADTLTKTDSEIANACTRIKKEILSLLNEPKIGDGEKK